ncbi:MAG: carboxypeptidase-like regulatory domain-containing protein, partial [Pedobacter sp.]
MILASNLCFWFRPKVNFSMFKYLLSFVFSIFFISAQAQNLSISGRVIDDFGKAKANVNVNIKRLNLVAQTDSNGVFKLANLTAGKYKLVISAIGYATKTVDIQLESNHQLVDVKLVQLTNNLAQVTISEKLGETRKKQESLN